jgi:CDP-diacylglycerol---glycerol-3-phosphate 3-phosphatidyltransferase
VKRAADLCTLLRIVLAPLFAWSVVVAHHAASPLPFALYAAAAVSDFADGRLARAAGEGTSAGRLFDHGADALFLFPALVALAAVGRISPLLPAAATTAFTLYVLDGWRRGALRGTVELAPSRFGAAAGVCNYVVTGLATGALWAGPSALDGVIRAAAVGVALLNVAAAVERAPRLLARRAPVAAER